ncbi:MAG TPA: lipopolysaccharide assembly protein LapA domain-containing protein [Acidimicrobiales bacterium]|nr:lipopolysaccharide assembly protein LapA domain-containing protein [Acidimicrobiales bacterium]
MAEDEIESGAAAELPAEPQPHRIEKSGSGAAWVGAGAGAVVLAALIVFIAENAKAVHVTFLFLHAQLDLGLALLIAALVGAVLVLIIGTVRILVLRRLAKRHGVEDVAAFRRLGRAVARRRGERPPG